MSAPIVTSSLLTGSSNKNSLLQNSSQLLKSRFHSNKNDEFSTTNEIRPDVKFSQGQLVWAKLNNHPWWPCRIAKENSHESNGSHVKLINNNKLAYFVEFFGPSTVRAWTYEINLFYFDGIESFKVYAQNQVDRATTKIAKEKLAEKFQLKVAINQRDHWEKAIEQANFYLRTNKSFDETTINRVEKLKKISQKQTTNENQSKLLLAFKSDDQYQDNISWFKTDLLETNENNHQEDADDEEVNSEDDDDDEASLQPTSIFEYEQPTNNVKMESIDDYENCFGQVNHLNASSNDGFSATSSNISQSQFTQVKTENLPKQKRGRKPKVIQHISDNLISNSEILNAYIKKLKPTKVKLNDSKEHCLALNNNTATPTTSSYSHSLSDSSDDDENDKNYSDAKKVNYHIKSQLQPLENNNSYNDRKLSDISFSPKMRKAKLKSTKKKSKKVKQSMSKLLKETKKKDKFASLIDCNSISSEFVLDADADAASGANNPTATAETYLIDRYNYAVRHIKQGLSIEEACNKYRVSKGALLKCLSGGTAPRGKKTRLTEMEENEIVEWLIDDKHLKYNDAIHLVFEKVVTIFQEAERPNPFNNGRPSMDWWYDFLSRHPQIMASKPDWLMRGKVNQQYIKDVQSGQLKCTKFRRALLSAIQYIQTMNDASNMNDETFQTAKNAANFSLNEMSQTSVLNSASNNWSLEGQTKILPRKSGNSRKSFKTKDINKVKTSQQISFKNIDMNKTASTSFYSQPLYITALEDSNILTPPISQQQHYFNDEKYEITTDKKKRKVPRNTLSPLETAAFPPPLTPSTSSSKTSFSFASTSPKHLKIPTQNDNIKNLTNFSNNANEKNHVQGDDEHHEQANPLKKPFSQINTNKLNHQNSYFKKVTSTQNTNRQNFLNVSSDDLIENDYHHHRHNTSNNKILLNTIPSLLNEFKSAQNTEIFNTSLNQVNEVNTLIDSYKVQPFEVENQRTNFTINQDQNSNTSLLSSCLSNYSSSSTTTFSLSSSNNLEQKQQNHLVVADDDDENDEFDFNLKEINYQDMDLNIEENVRSIDQNTTTTQEAFLGSLEPSNFLP